MKVELTKKQAYLAWNLAYHARDEIINKYGDNDVSDQLRVLMDKFIFPDSETGMSFDDYSNSKVYCEDLSKVEDLAGYDYEENSKGFIYPGVGVIQITGNNKYYLLICNEDWISNNLRDLELKLYEYAKNNQCI